MKQTFIAEIKVTSPFGFKSKYPFYTLMTTAIQHGDMISVHTNKLWGGDFEAISFVRRFTTKPILAKGLHSTNDDIQKAFDHGADYVLVVDRFCSGFNPTINYNRCFFEFSNFGLLEKELREYDDLEDLRYVCNNRDLNTGRIKPKSDIQMYLDRKLWTCQASGIKSEKDVNPNVDAFIVGEHLMNFVTEYR